MEEYNFSAIRSDFPMLQKKMHGNPLIYFDSAATAQKPKSVIEAITNFYQDHYGTVHRAIYQLSLQSTQEFQITREKIQRFLNASSFDEIIFTRGTTESINLVAYSFGKAFLNKGDEIIISEMEHHSNIVPWQMICEDKGCHLKVIPMNDKGELLLDEYKKMLSSKTKLVSIAHVSNSLGTINPIKEMASMAHEVGAYFLADGAQAVSHLPVDVQELDVDFYVFSGHKLFGPTGIGVLYGKRDLLNKMPPYQGGGDMIEKVTFKETTYNTLPLKFEAGTPMIAEVIGLGKAIDYLQSVGLNKIKAWTHFLLEELTNKLIEIKGLKIIGQAHQKSSIVSFTVEGIHHLDLGTLLDLRGIAIRTGHHCAQPTMQKFNIPGTARASLSIYNTPQEINQFVIYLKEVINLLR